MSARIAENAASNWHRLPLLLIMMKSIYTRLSATSAIAAAAALTTPAAAQDAVTTTSDPVAVESSATPAPAEPAATEAPTASTSTDTSSTEPVATPVKTARSATAAKVKAKPAPPVKSAVAQQLAKKFAPEKESATPPPPTPAVTEAAAPAPAAAPAAQANQSDETALAVGGGALALLLVGGAAAAMRRRRSHAEDAWHDEPMMLTEHEAVEPAPAQPRAVTPKHDPVHMRSAYTAPPLSAFSWGNAPAAPQKKPAASESWTERAMRGPTPDNPSLSLKKRLKRAAFFDKRERDAAAGKATPVEADAGLPERVTETREPEFA